MCGLLLSNTPTVGVCHQTHCHTHQPRSESIHSVSDELVSGTCGLVMALASLCLDEQV